MIRLIPTAVLLLMVAVIPARAAEVIGEVVRVQAEAMTGDRTLAAGDALVFGETVTTGPGARLELRLADGTGLTLGENAEMTLDAFVYEPGGGGLKLDVLAGAFAFVTGEIGKANPEGVQVTTPVSTIGIRGTSFWGGPLDDAYGVLLLKGATVTYAAPLTTGPKAPVAHGLGGEPDLVKVVLVNLAADLGYAPGDRVLIPPLAPVSDGASGGVSVVSDEEEFQLLLDVSFALPNKSTGTVLSNTAIDPTRWNLEVTPFRLGA